MATDKIVIKGFNAEGVREVRLIFIDISLESILHENWRIVVDVQ